MTSDRYEREQVRRIEAAAANRRRDRLPSRATWIGWLR